ncbi:MAG: IS4/IS5 family transposase [Balneolaceae bacterium]|nr:MAG: IS4/IS5 family transposase [Balneolaceae bacterium]
MDEYIELNHSKTHEKYPSKLRRVAVYNPETDQTIELITNQFTWTANTIGELYKARWEIEIFFKEIKQLLKIKSFLGTTANAVLIQIWTAMIMMLILKYLKACATYSWCLSNMVAFLRLNLFVKFDLNKLLNEPFKPPAPPPEGDLPVQINLFEWGD